MPTGPTQTATLPQSKQGTIDGDLILLEDSTLTADGQTAWIDVGPCLFRGSVVVEITSSDDAVDLTMQGADDTSGTNTVALESLAVATIQVGRFALTFSNQAQNGDTKRAIRLDYNLTTPGTIVVKIAYIAKGLNDGTA